MITRLFGGYDLEAKVQQRQAQAAIRTASHESIVRTHMLLKRVRVLGIAPLRYADADSSNYQLVVNENGWLSERFLTDEGGEYARELHHSAFEGRPLRVVQWENQPQAMNDLMRAMKGMVVALEGNRTYQQVETNGCAITRQGYFLMRYKDANGMRGAGIAYVPFAEKDVVRAPWAPEKAPKTVSVDGDLERFAVDGCTLIDLRTGPTLRWRVHLQALGRR